MSKEKNKEKRILYYLSSILEEVEFSHPGYIYPFDFLDIPTKERITLDISSDWNEEEERFPINPNEFEDLFYVIWDIKYNGVEHVPKQVNSSFEKVHAEYLKIKESENNNSKIYQLLKGKYTNR
jgi:hypothetical protein